MDYTNLDAIVKDVSNFNSHFQGQSRNDGSTYGTSITDSGITNFKINSNNIGYIAMHGDGYVYFRTSSNSSNYGVLRVNQTDMASWNMWYQYGTVGLETKLNFARVRWDGQSSWNAAHGNEATQLIFDVILLSNHSIYLIIEKWPPSNYGGNNSFAYGNKSFTYSPSATNLKFGFVPSDENGTNWSLMNPYAEPKTVALLKYFIRDGDGKLYSVQSGSLTEVSDVSEENGMDTLPSYDIYKTLINPEILMLSSYNKMHPKLTETYQPQFIDDESEDYICDYKVNRVWITADGSTKFQMSFDGGSSWFYYENGEWVDSSDDQSIGNTKQEVHDIPMAQWQAKNVSSKIRFRWRLTSSDNHVDKIEIGNQDSYEGAYGEECPY